MVSTNADEASESPDTSVLEPPETVTPETAPRLRPARPNWSLQTLGPWLLVAGLMTAYLLISLARYYRFAPTSWDLGLFTEEIKQYAHFHAPIDDARAPGYEILGEHFSPIVALVGPFFLLFPTPVTVLVAQAFLFGLGAVPLVRYGAERIGAGAGYAIGVAYGLSFGLAEAVDADFHEIAFAVPVISFSMIALLRGRYRQAALWSLLLLFCKEDLGITVVLPIGIALILWGRTLLGAVVAAAGTAGSLLEIYWIIPALNATHQYEYWNKGGCADPTQPGGAKPITCLIGQSMQSAGGKMELVFLLLAITAFVALRSPLVLFAVPNLASRFITTNSTFWGTGWHYNAVLMPILFVAAADGIVRARSAGVLPPGAGTLRRWARGVSGAMGRNGAVATMAVAFALVPQFAYNQLFDPNTFTFDPRTQALSHAMSLVPDGVMVETTINMLAPLSARDDAFWVGNAAAPVPPEYVVFDQVVSGFSPPITDVPGFEQQRHPGAHYAIVYQDGFGIYVLHRTS
ncbi:MAG TPA: DUF2079 domain-containing protein [Actinocrinis sp.]|uniref:DUF2079 domain-containing protein n=1 Tax=Actinocrinis sp. TaxID=1920516 RepID=UPI002DDDB8AD|nr:DUF2079 domain-containing protein [Actinocrinis sp.]HEV2347341.1 DUF2079 domain-containing protein [Actinocrinis sp.]